MDAVPKTLGDALRRTASEHPQQEAVVGDGVRWTFQQLDTRVDRLAAGMIDLGLERGDRVAVWLANTPNWILLYLACARIGAVVVPINTRYKADEVEYILKESGAKLLVMMEKYWNIDFLSMFRSIVPDWVETGRGIGASKQLSSLRLVILSDRKMSDGSPSIEEVASARINASLLESRTSQVTAEDPLIIVYTSGTTGYPKGVVHSHRALRNAFNIANGMRVESGDRVLAHMPFYHVGGAITAVLPSIIRGAALIIMDQWRPADAIALIENEKITILGGIPTHYIDLLEVIAPGSGRVGSLKTAWTGGATVTSELALAVREKLGIKALQVAYGMTETAAATTLSGFDDPPEVACGNKGKVIGDFDVNVFGEDDSVLPIGQVGEIRVKGYPVMVGYYNDPAATKEAMTADGWFKTGDLGRFDAEGYLAILGRSKDMFIVGGSNAYPAEIERILQANPLVRQAVVVGVPDKRLGEVGFAFIELSDEKAASTAAIIEYCRSKMADFKVPRHIEIVSHLPRTDSGKLQRHMLISRAREQVKNVA